MVAGLVLDLVLLHFEIVSIHVPHPSEHCLYRCWHAVLAVGFAAIFCIDALLVPVTWPLHLSCQEAAQAIWYSLGSYNCI